VVRKRRKMDGGLNKVRRMAGWGVGWEWLHYINLERAYFQFIYNAQLEEGRRQARLARERLCLSSSSYCLPYQSEKCVLIPYY
jgi:hypothetical protein